MNHPYSRTKTTIVFLFAVCSILLSCSKKDNPTTNKSKVAITQASNDVLSKASLVRTMSESLSNQYAKMRAKQVSNVSYKLTIILDNEKQSFDGITEINFDLAKGNKNDLTIDFDQGVVKAIKVNGENIPFDYEKWFITIKGEKLSSGNNTVAIEYRRPYANDGAGLHRFVDPENSEIYLYTDFEPYYANRFFPHFDQPDIKATYTMEVTAPAHWQIISAMRETNIVKNGNKKTWFFPTSAKFSSYIFSLHAGNYKVWEDNFQDIPLRLFARQSLAKYIKTEQWFTPTKQSFAFFNQYFDVPYPFIKYDQVIVPDFNSGAMENVAAVTFSEMYISRGEKSTKDKIDLADVIAHEMAHMWFGDLVTMRWWNGLWLNESFATYMANLALAKASNYDQIWDVFYAETKQWAYETDDSVNTHAIELPVATTADALTNFDGITYGKGASVLHQLTYYLGKENFRMGVSNYLKKYAYENTDLDDFMTELGKTANKDMSQWTQDWLYQAGLNTIKVNFQCAEGKISQLSIDQSATKDHPRLRQQRVQIGLYNVVDNKMVLSTATAVTYQGGNTNVTELVGQKCPDLIYPNEGDWGYVKVDLDNKSFAATKLYINNISNTTMRLMLWQSLSDRVDDAKMPADKFVHFVIANIEGEKDYNVLSNISDSLNNALNYLNTASILNHRDFLAIHKQVEKLYLKLLEKATPGSDFQKLWYDQYVSISKTDEQLQHLLDILSAKVSYPGLVIDQDKRWQLVSILNRYQFSNYQALLTAEKSKDSSDTGVKYAIYSEVVRPEADVKAKWFKVLINNPSNLKLSTLRIIMDGMFLSDQQQLEEPYQQKIIAHINTLNSGSDLGLLEYFANNMLPFRCTTEMEKKLAALLIEYKDMKPQVVKAIKTNHQEVGRCINRQVLLK